MNVISLSFLIALIVAYKAASPARSHVGKLIGIVSGLIIYSAAYFLMMLDESPSDPLWQEKIANISGVIILYFSVSYFESMTKSPPKYFGHIKKISPLMLVLIIVLPFQLTLTWGSSFIDHLTYVVVSIYVLLLIVGTYGVARVYTKLDSSSASYRQIILSYLLFASFAIIVDVIPYYRGSSDMTLAPLGPIAGLIFLHAVYRTGLRDDLYSLKNSLTWLSMAILGVLIISSIFLATSFDWIARISGVMLAIYLLTDLLVQKKAESQRLQKVVEDYQNLRTIHLDTEDFLMDIAHRLKSPLAVIENQLLEARTAAEPAAKGRKLAQAAANTHNLRHSMKNLLFAGKIDHEQVELRKRPVNLTDLISGWEDELHSLAPHHPVELRTSSAQLTASIDEILLKDAVFNLVDNAVKYSPPGSLITVSVERRRWHAVVAVRDQGRGIPPRELKKIFRRHHQAARHDRSVGSVGLGLALVKWTLEQHGGHIAVHGQSDRGTKVELHLPLAEPAISTRRRAVRVQTTA